MDPMEAVAIVEQQDRAPTRVDDDAAEPAVELLDKRGAALDVTLDKIGGSVRATSNALRDGARRRLRFREILAGENQAHIPFSVPCRHGLRERSPVGDPSDID